VRRLRKQWCQAVACVDPQKLVFVDESGVNTAMTRTRGRARRGQRVLGAVPHGDWKTVTMLGAIRCNGMAAAATAPYSTDTDLFRAFVTQMLVPALHRGDVVVWDGLAPHKATGLKEAVEDAGAELMPLPPYSPDFSPIEPCWSKIKEIVRAAEPRDEAAIGRATTKALAAVTPEDARGWFRHCGYMVH